ncbi:MAG: hypothetical protein R2708_11415 [Vicinamibacterales bacterium]
MAGRSPGEGTALDGADGPPDGTDAPRRPAAAPVAGAVRAGDRFLDDFAAMAQVVHRRFSRAVEAGGPFPDLLVIDGGRGQLDAAYGALERLGLANPVAVGLAKREELVVTRKRCAGRVPADERALRLLQQFATRRTALP